MSIRVKCPFCLSILGSTGSRDNIAVYADRGFYHCFRCGKSGKITKWIANKLGVPESFSHIVENEFLTIDACEKKESSLPAGYVPLYPYRSVQNSFVLSPYLAYLRSRAVSARQIECYKIGVVLSPPKEHWYERGCFVFPVLDGLRNGYVRKSRKYGSYANSEGLGRLDALYNGDCLARSDLDTVYVVEGVFDAIALRGEAVSTLGADCSDGQLERLSSVAKRVVFCYDGDAWKSCMVLSRRLTLRGHDSSFWVRLPPGRDPGDLGYDLIKSLPFESF